MTAFTHTFFPASSRENSRNQAASARLPNFRLAAVSALLVLVGLGTGGQAMAIEMPEYEVVYTEGDVEFRRYESYLVAETVIEGNYSFKSLGNEGFRRLFRYITGGNSSAEKIEMTAPVARSSAAEGEKIAMTSPVQRSAAEEGEAVSFMLPSKYTMETAPVPADKRIRVKEVPARLVAVVRYSGRWTEENFEEGRNTLLAELKDSGVEPLDDVETALYDPPYTLPFMRRNEVMVEVNALPASVRQLAAAPGVQLETLLLQ